MGRGKASQALSRHGHKIFLKHGGVIPDFLKRPAIDVFHDHEDIPEKFENIKNGHDIRVQQGGKNPCLADGSGRGLGIGIRVLIKPFDRNPTVQLCVTGEEHLPKASPAKQTAQFIPTNGIKKNGHEKSSHNRVFELLLNAIHHKQDVLKWSGHLRGSKQQARGTNGKSESFAMLKLPQHS